MMMGHALIQKYHDCDGVCINDEDGDDICDEDDKCIDKSACNYSSKKNKNCIYDNGCGCYTLLRNIKIVMGIV